MAFPETFLTELTERNDIVDVVSGYVRLTKKSGSNQFGLCPFHSEKTPSFSVSADKQIYHCFGCGKGGGVINFIMEIENLSYPEAVEFLAKRAGMPMPEESNDRESRRRSRMLALNRDAARFFYEQLSTPAGQRARDYMQNRRIGPATAKNFGVGFAPDSWDSLVKAMREKGYTELELLDAGLVRRGKNGTSVYDTFRDRLMFPVIDVRGNVIGFSGRILGDDEPKYMNSPETLVFNKSRNLFALNLAKKSKSGYIILAEGNIDVVSMHQAGFDSAVASLGTSLTPEQARLLSRYTNQVIIAYDNDGAGKKAAQRAIGILEKLDLKVRVLAMTGAKDPDEYIKTRGAAAFRNLLEGSDNQIDYRIKEIAKKYDFTVQEQKIDFLNEIYDVIARLSDMAQREIYAGKIAELVGINKDAVISDIEKKRNILLRRAGKTVQREATRVQQRIRPSDRTIKYANPESAKVEENLIRLIYTDPELCNSSDLPSPEDFSSDELGNIFSILIAKGVADEPINISTLEAVLSPTEERLLVDILENRDSPRGLINREKTFVDYVKYIKQFSSDRKEKNKPIDLNERAKQYREERGAYKA